MLRLLEPEEIIKLGDKLLPSGIHYRFDFVPIVNHGSKCGKMVICREVDAGCDECSNKKYVMCEVCSRNYKDFYRSKASSAT